jgi:hypothetical protein
MNERGPETGRVPMGGVRIGVGAALTVLITALTGCQGGPIDRKQFDALVYGFQQYTKEHDAALASSVEAPRESLLALIQKRSNPPASRIDTGAELIVLMDRQLQFNTWEETVREVRADFDGYRQGASAWAKNVDQERSRQEGDLKQAEEDVADAMTRKGAAEREDSRHAADIGTRVEEPTRKANAFLTWLDEEMGRRRVLLSISSRDVGDILKMWRRYIEDALKDPRHQPTTRPAGP